MNAQQLINVLYSIVALALIISVVTDFHSRKIKNVVTFPTIAISLLLRLIFGGWGTAFSDVGLFSGLLGMVVGALVFWFMACKGGMGDGDVKLMAAVGAGVGLPSIIFCFVGTGIVGGVHAIVVLLWRGEFFYAFKCMGQKAVQKMRPVASREITYRTPKIPYGFAIALGSVWGIWWQMHQQAAAASML